MTYRYIPQGVCPHEIDFELDGDKIIDLSFVGGCSGNLEALSIMIKGKTVDEISSLFKGHTCGNKTSSCMDQLAIALEEAQKVAS
ncbi:TIGR03905 family TSCPD domain-containing protein [Acetobacterium paludosum]|uniref:ribonucleoside-diphosphate reductase n=1 Tax=Acetobacterium paludosum TaxID=52693 RepID=A0A923HV92_9FIRM|nr:TIGR03905 family TSCPD domain-containing protein [Acetobacterium paludosum]MBC3889184.1 TIGR03905 family TSCPD domain-containing protein [Acetobacterium paludosum]